MWIMSITLYQKPIIQKLDTIYNTPYNNNIMKNKVIKSIGIIAASGSIFMAIGWPFFNVTVHCKRKKKTKSKFKLSHMNINHPSYKFEKEYEDGKAWCRKQNMLDCYIRSIDGLILHAYYLPADNAERFVLLSHGYKGSGFGDFAYIARFLHENKCNLFFIDQRCCGESEGKFITFGSMEQYDIQRWTYYIAKRNKDKLPIYLYGTSMGAAAVLMASGQKLPKEVRGLIADCGFQSMKGQLRYMASNWFHLNWIELLLFRINLFCSFFAGFRMEDADTAMAMKKNKRPVLFFHGMQDTFVNPENSRNNYSLCLAPKELVIIPGARHLCSCYENPELYRKKILEFFTKYD